MLNTIKKTRKMTLTFKPESYAHLLAQYQPKIITTGEENDAVIALAEQLDRQGNRTLEEDALLELLVVLIEKFEDERSPMGNLSTPQSILQHLMEVRNLKQSDLVGILGSKGVVSEVINGKKGIRKICS